MTTIKDLELALQIAKAQEGGEPLEWEYNFVEGWKPPQRDPFWYLVHGGEIRLKPTSILTDEQRAQGWVEWHGGENPIPGKRCEFIVRNGGVGRKGPSQELRWGHHDQDPADIIAYRVVEPTYVDLGPEDVPPGSVFKHTTSTYWYQTLHVSDLFVVISSMGNSELSYAYLREYCLINRSLSAGAWDPNAWEPCRKEAI